MLIALGHVNHVRLVPRHLNLVNRVSVRRPCVPTVGITSEVNIASATLLTSTGITSEVNVYSIRLPGNYVPLNFAPTSRRCPQAIGVWINLNISNARRRVCPSNPASFFRFIPRYRYRAAGIRPSSIRIAPLEA